MNDTELLFYAFMKDCPRLLKAVQDNALELMDITDNKVTYIIRHNYLPTERDYMDFLFDLDECDITYQMQFVTGNYFLRLYV